MERMELGYSHVPLLSSSQKKIIVHSEEHKNTITSNLNRTGRFLCLTRKKNNFVYLSLIVRSD